jgi:phage tail-like protein
MGVLDGTKIGMANRFAVRIEPKTHDLGTWSGCTGLEITWEVNKYQAGDQGNALWIFPGNNKYSDVTLTRTVCEQTREIHKWLSETSFGHEPHIMTIELYDEKFEKGQYIMDWTLENALPKQWKVEKFEAGASKVATETLVIAHTGFLNDQKQVWE